MSHTPTLVDVIQSLAESRLADLHVAMPATVLSYDASNQSITAQPSVKRGYRDDDGVRQVEALPPITNVPVVFPGSGGFRVTFPVQAGDTVLLVFSEQSLDKWLVTGTHSDPGDDRRFAMSDAIAIPGLRDFKHALSNAPTNRMSIGYDSGPSIEINTSEINAGGSHPLAFESNLDALAARVVACETALSLTPGTPTYPGTSILNGG